MYSEEKLYLKMLLECIIIAVQMITSILEGIAEIYAKNPDIIEETDKRAYNFINYIKNNNDFHICYINRFIEFYEKSKMIKVDEEKVRESLIRLEQLKNPIQ